MPKMKTNRGAAKRFKQSASGKVRYRKSNRNHILTKKTTKRKRHLRGLHVGSASDRRSVERLIGER